ncbi:MAG: alpha/beta fold hydrolase [Paracoccus sp. (in: a-proteobacteria)]|uniref:alpha/beta fold hydrolase n=1 Tax=Paracoccus sp. TaxID=267 RepID=UPI0026DEDF8B|nr:alpha/beta fold hydrolase [Paracoccus sp. (in: a-proteobacteria)]MDO5622191.1 alpha/beta fold hydrolase [Paracoccus sp. (in: a-proteobacteria)]
MLAFTETGAGRPVILVHGLFGSGKNLGGIARRLAGTHRAISVDMRNHGDSFRDPAHDYPDLAADLAEVIAAQGGQADIVGHSMGGKAAMWLALTRPEMVNRLVIMDIAPVAYAHDQNRVLNAMRDMDLANLTRRSEADTRLAAAIQDPGTRAFLLQSLDLKAEPPRWKMNLQVLADQMDQLTSYPPLGDKRFDGPALFLAGSASDYVRPEYDSIIRQHFPQAQITRMPDLGHWLHAEKPAEVADLVAGFLT